MTRCMCQRIKRVQQTVGVGGKTYIGDCKMGALATRAWIAQSGDYHLCPLAGKQMPAETLEALLAPVFAWSNPWNRSMLRRRPTMPPELLAEGYTMTVNLEDPGERPAGDLVGAAAGGALDRPGHPARPSP